MGFFEKFFEQHDTEKKRLGLLKEEKDPKKEILGNLDKSLEERRQAAKDIKVISEQENRIKEQGRDTDEMLKQKIREQNEATRAKLAETRKFFKEGVDITDAVNADMEDDNDPEVIVVEEGEQKAA